MDDLHPVKTVEIPKTSGAPPRDHDEPSDRRSSPSRDRPRDRTIRRVTKRLAALVLIGLAVFGLLLVVTPSAREATVLVRAQARKHGIGDPVWPAPRRFAEALVATEDHRFYSILDPGIDPIAIARAILEVTTGHRGDPGGSTIAQQLAKMLYTSGRAGLATKLEQVLLAIKLSLTYSRSEILSMYAQVAYDGSGYYGLAAASCGYFGKATDDLTWAQAAMLAGVVNAPTADDPRTHPVNAQTRETHVLDRLVSVGDLTRPQANAALSRPLDLVDKEELGEPRRGCVR